MALNWMQIIRVRLICMSVFHILATIVFGLQWAINLNTVRRCAAWAIWYVICSGKT